MPEDSEDDPVPAILNYIPYRKNEGMAMDAPDQRYVAGHGYTFVRSTFAEAATLMACCLASI